MRELVLKGLVRFKAWRRCVEAEPVAAIGWGAAITAFRLQLKVSWQAFRHRHEFKRCLCGIWVHKSRPTCVDKTHCVWAPGTSAKC
jgi:hypothetical protein